VLRVANRITAEEMDLRLIDDLTNRMIIPELCNAGIEPNLGSPCHLQ
jgi:hypothetical protein